MSEVEAQNPTLAEEEHVEELGDAVGQEHAEETQSQEEHGEHAQTDVIEDPSVEVEENAAGVGEAAEVEPKSPVEPTADVATEEVKESPSAPTSPSKPKLTAKPTVTTKSPAGKAYGTPGTPLVKKVISSGTFGPGTTRAPPAASKTTSLAGAISKPSTTPTSPVKRAVSAVAPRASMAAPTTARTPAPPTAATRRASLVPPTRQSTMGTAAKPAVTTSTANRTPSATGHAARPSVTSPDSVASLKSSSSAKPRAPVTDAAKRATPTSRPSLGPTSAARTPSSPSISSIKEVRGDGKAIEELQAKLTDVTSSLTAKTEALEELTSQVATLQRSFDEARADSDAKQATVDQLEQAKSAAEAELASAKESLAKLQAESEEGSSVLKGVKDDLEIAKSEYHAQTKLVQQLQAQTDRLETDVKAAKENLELLRSSSGEASEAAATAAAVEHEALLKAKTDLEGIREEIEALETVHAKTLAEAQAKVESLEESAARSVALEAQLAELKAENDDKANKVSELEVEILELREEQEKVEEERATTLGKIKELEEEAKKAAAVMKAAVEAAQIKEEELSQSSSSAATAHAEEIQKANEEYEKLSAQLQAVQDELNTALVAIESAKAEAAAAAEEQSARLEVIESTHKAREAELQEEIQKVSAELAGQEAQYNTKVDAVKAEHDQLLQEAFSRAKSEAGSVHSQDLQALRAESQATIEQLRTAHQSTIESLKAEHHAALDNQVKVLEKQIAGQALELNAAREDLAKAKTAATAAISELETVKTHLEETKRVIASLDKSDKDSAIAQLSKELSNAHEEHAALKDMFMASNEHLREITNNHVTELEEAAKGRVEEVTKLKAVHQEEIDTLTKDRTALTMQLSDLQGELSTLKAQLTPEVTASPRSNGAAHARSSSITRDDLQKMHEAHNLKLYDLQAEHDRAMRVLKEELETVLSKADELNQEVSRKTMEIQYLEQETDESQDQITRYVRIFGFKSFVVGLCSLAVVYGLF
ncbi:hypothetical protein BDY19DRAFT_982152 [Irpex rosettiformis]|uniref:Uncharacterized protein n=1 Tax=Irpex rosettiformis TaxID=378272 RepID=A0ACB8UK69_9APHY|nr:hypothetical protein BDY19DRAFT_982152 [Irpex rosettiformis]